MEDNYYNYSILNSGESTLYNIGGVNISGGISIPLLITFAVVSIILHGLFFVICTKVFHKPYFDPFAGIYKLSIYVTAASALISIGINKLKIQQYTIIQYLAGVTLFLISPKNSSFYERCNKSKSHERLYFKDPLD